MATKFLLSKTTTQYLYQSLQHRRFNVSPTVSQFLRGLHSLVSREFQLRPPNFRGISSSPNPSKEVDLVSEAGVETLSERIKHLNRIAPIRLAKYGIVDRDFVLGVGGYDLDRIESEVHSDTSQCSTHKHENGHEHHKGHHHDHVHDSAVSSVSIVSEGTLDLDEEHPEAKSLRTRSMPNYNSFSIIYGDESANQVGKIANDMTMVPFDDKDPHGVRSSRVVEFVDKQTPGSSDRLRTTWTPTMDRYFIELMIEQVQKGYKNNTMFCKKAWKIMVTSFNEHFGLGVEKDVLKSRLKKLRLRYNIIKSLLDHRGFCWDETRQMVTADDLVWDDYVKAHPEARPFRTITIPEYAKLYVVFGSENSKGRGNSSGRSNANHIVNEKIGGESGGSQSPTISAAHGDQCVMQAQPEAWAYKIKTWPDSPVDMPESSSHSDGGLDTYNHLGKRPLSEALNPPNSRKARRGTDEAMVDVLRQMALAVTSLANNKNENENSISCEQVVNALTALPDIDEDLFLDACDLLEDEGKAKMFLALDVTIRKKWLMRKLRPQ